MADSEHTTEHPHNLAEVVETHAVHEHDQHAEVNPMEISGQMVVWTWIVFAIVLAVLYKVAWKPILSTLDKREKDIQDSIDNAIKVREELDSIEDARVQTIAEADKKSKAVLEAARKGAHEQARVIEDKAREEAQIIAENASREIEASRAKAEESLRIESAAWARELAGKLIVANLDDEKNRALTDQLIQEL
ncbi:MAG: F0F1 ATP synthase subunit B [Pontiella sp.]